MRDVGLEDTLFYDGLVQPSGSSFSDEESQSSKSAQTRNEVHMQLKLEEALDMLKRKDIKISELESTLSLLDKKTEHEEFLTKRIAAELEYLVIAKTIENMKADHIDQSNRTVQQKNVAQTSLVHVQLEDATKLKNKVRRYVSCFFIQSVLLLVVLYLFVLKFSSQNKVVIPT